MKLSEIRKLILCIVVCQLVGFIGSFFTAPAIPTWYAALSKPSFTPPNWVFGPAWITLYFLMAIAAYLVWRQGLNVPGVKTALLLFCLQLVLNGLWSPAFFGMRSTVAGGIVIVLLWIAIILTIWKFFPLSVPAAVLLVPYLLWVSYATVLNVSLIVLNT